MGKSSFSYIRSLFNPWDGYKRINFYKFPSHIKYSIRAILLTVHTFSFWIGFRDLTHHSLGAC